MLRVEADELGLLFGESPLELLGLVLPDEALQGFFVPQSFLLRPLQHSPV